jgi:hypothetical protein
MGLGPTFLGFASDRFARANFAPGHFQLICPGGKATLGAPVAIAQACHAASAIGIRLALFSITGAFLWASIHFLLASRTLKQDLYRAPPTTSTS